MSAQVPPAYVFGPQERPLFPGAPFVPAHTPGRRAAYACAAVCTGVGASFGYALVNVNVGNIAGSLGLYVVEASVLPAVYVAMNASANLTLVRARAQFGIPRVVVGLLVAYALAALVQLLVPGLASAVVVRAVSGMSGAALTTLTIYYLLQIFPPKQRPLAIVIGIGITQLPVPLARLLPVELLAADQWRGLHLCELAVALGLIALVIGVRLPPSERTRVFEPLDLVTFALVVPAMLLICEVIALGRFLWWTDTPWLGLALAAAIPLLALAVVVELRRPRPLIRFGWLGTPAILRFGAVALLLRLALAEQTFGAVGLLTLGGLTNDQLHMLFVVVAVAMVLGIVVAALTLSESRVLWQVIVAALIISLGAGLDSFSTSLSRPHQLMVSQALLGFGTTLFVGPSLAFGFMQVIRGGGADFLVTFLVLFSVTQNVGSLLGSAVLGSWQTIETRRHAGALSEHLVASDPDVVARLRAGSASVASAVPDPAAQAAQGGALLTQSLQREAGVLAFNEVFRGVAIAGVTIALSLMSLIAVRAWRRPPAAPTPSPS